MLKASFESDNAKTLGTRNNSGYSPSIMVEYDPHVTGIVLDWYYKQVNKGWSGFASATVYPTNALDRTVYWTSNNPGVVSVDRNSGLLCARSEGTAAITATTADGGFTATCTIDVCNSHDVLYVNITSDAAGDSFLYVTKFRNGDFYFQAYDATLDEWGELYTLTQEKKDELDTIYEEYIALGTYPYGTEGYFVSLARQGLIEATKTDWDISVDSDEFYGLWMHYSRYHSAYAHASQFLAQLVGTALIIADTIYQCAVLVKSMQMTPRASYYISNSEYISTVDDNTLRINAARKKQISTGYTPDDFSVTTLKKGSKIYGLLKGQSAWYTTKEMVELSNYDQLTIYQGLQICPSAAQGYRKFVAEYEVLEDIIVPTGQALNNTYYNGQFLGNGGYTQFYIENYSSVLRFISQTNLNY